MNLKKAHTVLFSVLLAISSCQCLKRDPPVEQSPQSFALLYLTGMHGWVEPCGCTSEPLGGVARLATVVLEAKQKYGLGTTLIDGGNLLFDSLNPILPVDLCQENARIELLLGTLHDLSLIGTFPSQFDDVMGPAFRDEKLVRHQIANLKAAGKTGFVTQNASFKLGILFLDESNAPLIDAKASALKNEGARAVVVMTHLPRTFFQTSTTALSHVDVVILGSADDELPASAQKVGLDGPIFVSAAKQGQYLGVIEFRLNQEGQKVWKLDDRNQKRELRVSLLSQRKVILESQFEDAKDNERKEFLKTKLNELDSELRELSQQKDEPLTNENVMTARAIALSRTIEPHRAFDVRLKDYEKQIPGLVAQCESKIECKGVVEGQASFVGAETCRTCHSAAYDFWQKAVYQVNAKDEKGNAIVRKSGHAIAYETLQEKAKTEDRSCIECHTAGFMQPGGFCKVKEVGPFKGVQCESCHGAGSLHAATANKSLIKRDVPEKTCRGCHHVPHIATTESFVYEQKLTRILGTGHGELLLSKIKHEPQK